MLHTLSQGKLLENHTLHSRTYLFSPYMAVPPPPPPGHHTEPLPVCFRIPDSHAKRNPASRAQSLMNSASRVAVRSCCPSRYSVFSQIPHRILIKSRILKLLSRPYIKRLFSPRVQNKKGRKRPADRKLCILMSLKRRNVKFKTRIKLNRNILIPQIC